MQRSESTRDYQRTGGEHFRAYVLVRDEDGESEWQDVQNPTMPAGQRLEWSTAESAFGAALKIANEKGGTRVRVKRFTIEIASEYGWRTDDQPVLAWGTTFPMPVKP
jgi:hypothetical protein